MITSALALAVERASKSSAEEQEVIAALIIDELESEEKWDSLLSNSKGKLAEMANRAISEHRAGKTYPIPDSRK